MATLTRRELLFAGGALVAGGAAGFGAFAVRSGARLEPGPTQSRDVTVAEWAEHRRTPYLVGHRGAGGVRPEHTLVSYRQAVDWGAQCIEVSVVMSSDGVLYCHHDLTLDRTTTLTGPTRSQPSSLLDRALVSMPRLGPRWMGDNRPPMPRLSQLFEELGGRVVMCVEPKDDAAFPAILSLIAEHGIRESIILKLDHTSKRIAQAHEAGFPVFAYLGNPEVTTVTAVAALAKRLDATRDCIVIPTRSATGLLAPELVQAAVRTGLPVWVFPVHRRYEVTYFAQLGVQGMIAADVGYISGNLPLLKADTWSKGELVSGELTRDPYSEGLGLQWPGDGVLALPTPGRPAFLNLGSFSPIRASSYRIAFDIRFDPAPKDTWQHVSIAFGHADDQYYSHRAGQLDGYHAILRGSGLLGLYAHTAGEIKGKELATPEQGRRLADGLWSRVTLDVTPDSLCWSRDDGSSIEAKDSRFRGGYFHIGSSATEGRLLLRGLSVS